MQCKLWLTVVKSSMNSKCYTFPFVSEMHPICNIWWTQVDFSWIILVCCGSSHFKNSGHLHHTLWGISLPYLSTKYQRTAAFPKGLLQTFQQISAVGIYAVFILYLSVHLGWYECMYMFAFANPVCVIWGPIKATEGQRCKGLYQVKSSIDRAFSTILCLVMRLHVKQ